ncbi:hypothetical protein [Halomonas koreensis]|uniref:Uncharacterized protein n=1 Tax=Halomonas koreensis TaxID=245385 RepID=A0ABU1G2U4_9GAMM|nr:hypothetical protein [Halomonas koreensis]MDR5867268.1 hypothetical protein [Halomonas koreensis]
MSLANPMTITDVFRRHGMATAVTAPVLQLQELAMAVSLMGRYEVRHVYRGDTHSLHLEVWQTPAGAGTSTVAQVAEHQIPLPHEDYLASEALSQLGVAIQCLTAFLMEGQPS